MVMYLFLGVSTNRLVGKKFECKHNMVYVTFLMSTDNGDQKMSIAGGGQDVFSFVNEDKDDVNIKICKPSPDNMYCRHKDTIWNEPLCYQRIHDSKRHIKCPLVSLKGIDDDPQSMFVTQAVKITYFKNEQSEKEKISKMIPFTPYMVCF